MSCSFIFYSLIQTSHSISLFIFSHSAVSLLSSTKSLSSVSTIKPPFYMKYFINFSLLSSFKGKLLVEPASTWKWSKFWEYLLFTLKRSNFTQLFYDYSLALFSPQSPSSGSSANFFILL